MRKLTIIMLVILLATAALPSPQAQQEEPQKESKTECASTPSLKQFEAELARKNLRGWQAIDPPTDAPYHLPLSIHIVRRSNGTGGLTLNDLAASINDLNRFWQPVGIQFFVFGAIDYINSDTHFNVPNDQTNRDALRRVNPVGNTINVYFTNLANLCGQSTFTTDAVQGVLMDITCASVASGPANANLSTFAHEVGHYFDLYHTHDTWPDTMGNPTKVECPSGSNCSTAGDLVCDTPADPNLRLGGVYRVDNNCAYDNSATTPSSCNSTAYNPPTRNLMSYSRPGCRTEFTAEQIRRTLQILRDTANRRNLIISKTRYVDPLASASNAECSYKYPCSTVIKALGVALRDDHIFIKPGDYSLSPLTIGADGRGVVLEKWRTGAGTTNIR